MKDIEVANPVLNPVVVSEEPPEPVNTETFKNPFGRLTGKRIKGGLLFVLGYFLSPLSWWNDLIFNLPIAYGLGYVCNWLFPGSLLTGLVVGYWFSNVLGIFLMQLGALDVLQGQPRERNLKKEILTGVISSTIYTLAILALVQFKILDVPAILSGENPINLTSLLPTGVLGVKGTV